MVWVCCVLGMVFLEEKEKKARSREQLRGSKLVCVSLPPPL